MSSSPQTLEPQAERRDLVRLVTRVAINIFSVESVIMMALSDWQLNEPVINEGLIDACALTVMSGPLIYLWVAMPFATAARSAHLELAIELSAKLVASGQPTATSAICKKLAPTMSARTCYAAQF